MIKRNDLKRFLVFLLVIGAALSVWADGFIIVTPHGDIHPPRRPRPIPPRPPAFSPFPLEVVYHRVEVDINNQMAVTSIDQEFYNPTRRRLEGYYLFPLPKNAVIKKFSMFIDGKETQAELLDAKKARRIYEDIVRRQRDPALLEYSGTGVFKVRIFPIEPRSNKRVKISYREVLTKDNHTVEYLYPLNTEKFSAKPLKDVSIRVNLKSTENIKNLYCPTHNVEISRKGKKQAVIGFEEKNTKPDTDFKLYFTTDNKQFGLSLFSHKLRNEDGYFFLSLSPGFDVDKHAVIDKDIIFVLDTSGSMSGPKMRQAKKALLFCVENLNKNDRFEIIRFSTEAEALFDNLVVAQESNLRRAREFIDGLKAIGGTNMDDALSMALKMEKRRGRPCMVIFMTDGKPTIGETDQERLLARIKSNNVSSFRVFTFGIGNEINTHLLDKITETTRAYRTYITPEEDIEIKVSNFYSKVQSPVLSDIHLDFGHGVKVTKMYPVNLPDLFKGSSLTVLGRYRNPDDARIVLSGTVMGKEKKFTFNVTKGFSAAGDNGAKNDFIPPLWAARRVGYLLDQIRLHGKSKELVDEVTQLARTYGILTPYTSYLIVEDEEIRRHDRRLRRDHGTLSNVGGTAPYIKEQDEKMYKKMMELKSGAASVKTSRELQNLNYAENVTQKFQGKGQMNFVGQDGKTRNLTQQVRNIQGRAFYNVDKYWVDSLVQKQKNQQVKRIQFAGKEYFELLKNNPSAAQLLALGQNIRFVLNNTIYEIHE